MRIGIAVTLWAGLQVLPIALRADEGGLATLCRKDDSSAELKVKCTDGKSWTMKTSGLILPPLLRCSPKVPECCETGFRGMRDIQLQDLIRFGEGRPPACHMLVGDFLKNLPWEDEPAPAVPQDLSPDEVPGVPQKRLSCPKGQYPARGQCHDPAALARTALRAVEPPDENRVLVPEAGDVIHKLRVSFNRTGHCPQDALDISVLMRIYAAAQQRAQLFPALHVDVAPLIAHPKEPHGSRVEPALPVSCGYNATFANWYQNSFHCEGQGLCYNQSNASLEHDCVSFEREAGDPYFFPVQNCQNVPACRYVTSGQCTGVARLTPLGESIFLMIQENPNGEPYYYGVIFAPAPPPTLGKQDLEQAREAKELLRDILRQVKAPAERARLMKLIGPALE